MGLTILGILDQNPTVSANCYVDASEQFCKDQEFVRKIEQLEEDGSMVYQLPYMRYPENGSINNMSDYSHFVGYLHSDTLCWSYGAIAGREGYQWLASVNELPFEEQLVVIKESGFVGVYIDWNAYLPDERIALENVLENCGYDAYIQHADGAKVYYSFK